MGKNGLSHTSWASMDGEAQLAFARLNEEIHSITEDQTAWWRMVENWARRHREGMLDPEAVIVAAQAAIVALSDPGKRGVR